MSKSIGGIILKNLKFHGNQVITGPNSIEYLDSLKFQKTYIVTGGSSMSKNGTIVRIIQSTEREGGETLVHSGIKKNPTVDEINAGIESMRQFKPDTVIAVGGGSAIDAAKVMALFYEYPELNFDNALNEKLPKERKKIRFIAIPSTSGTATEVTRAAVVTFPEKSLKIGLKTDAFVPDIAILDGTITLSMPINVVAETGMDALTHAVECYMNRNLDDFTEPIAKGAIEGILKYLPISYLKGDIDSRQKMHNYQCLAGMAFSNVGLGISHGIAHAFGGRYDMGHGLLNAIVLPYAIEFNSRDEEVHERIKKIEKDIGIESLRQTVNDLNSLMHVPQSFKAAGLKEEVFERDFDMLVTNSLMGSTRVNPIKPTRAEMEQLLRRIYIGN